MSWYVDTQLFIYNGSTVYRIKKEYGIPVVNPDYENYDHLSFSKHLSLGNNKESDYASFISSFRPNGASNLPGVKAIHSQGLVITWVGNGGTWSREEQNSQFYNLPGVTRYESLTALLATKEKVPELEAKISALQVEAKNNMDEKQAVDRRLADLKAENSTLKDEVKRLTYSIDAEKSTNQKHEEILARFAALEALNLQVLDLASERVPHCGAGGGSCVEKQPCISGHTVPSNWVPFDDLDVLTFSKTTPLTIIKDTGALKFLEDNTTNVEASHFYRGVYDPIVLVNVEELIPNGEEARFDRDVWGRCYNAGIIYAARKQFGPEISVDADKTC